MRTVIQRNAALLLFKIALLVRDSISRKMFPRFVLFLGLLLIFVAKGFALTCYFCVGSPSSDCARGSTSAAAVQTCNTDVNRPSYLISKKLDEEHGNELEEDITASCISVQGTTQNITFYERTCFLAPSGVDICKFLAKDIKLVSCKVCSTNLCNI